MPNPVILQQTSANGTATPATVTLTGVTATDFLLLFIGCTGSTATSISTPTGDSWSSIQNQAGSGSGIPSFGMFVLPNAGAGSHTPSAVLTGTVTGWVLALFEVTQIPNPISFFSSNVQVNSSLAQLPNMYAGASPASCNPCQFFVYSVLRIGTTAITGAVSGLNNWAPPGYTNSASAWGASQQPLSGVQGLSLDTYFADSNAAWPCPWPVTAGLLASAVNSVQIKMNIASNATNPTTGALVTNIGGGANATVVPNFMQGMVGG